MFHYGSCFVVKLNGFDFKVIELFLLLTIIPFFTEETYKEYCGIFNHSPSFMADS